MGFKDFVMNNTKAVMRISWQISASEHELNTEMQAMSTCTNVQKTIAVSMWHT